jgi:hypothetical protein
MASYSRRADTEPSSLSSAVDPASPSPPLSEDGPDGPTGARLDELLERVAQPTLPAIERPFTVSSEPSTPTLRTARVARMVEKGAELQMRGSDLPVVAVLDDGVDRALIARTAETGDAVLVETLAGQDPVIVGVVQTRFPEKTELRGKDIVIDAEREVVIRAGRAAIRIREDGEVEVVGSRILTMSRGLFRIVGRVLRLN